MAITYKLIASTVTTGSSVTFSSIPATYTDLVIRASVGPEGFYNPSFDQFVRLWITTNASSGLISGTYIQGNGTTALSARETETSWWQAGIFTQSNANSANSVSSVEVYIPNYLNTSSKVMFANTTQENNTANGDTTRVGDYAGLTRSTSAITSITMIGTYAGIPAGSSFYLYGIKNS